MSAGIEPENNELVKSPGHISEKPASKLVKRGLDDVEHDTLTAEQIITARRENSHLKGLSDEAVTLAVKRPPYWEYRLYFQTLIDEVDGYESLRQARDLGVTLGISEVVPQEQTISWMLTRIDEEQELAAHFDKLVNHDLQSAFGAPGQSGDVAAIVMVSRQLGLLYKQFLEIAIRCARVQHNAVFDGIFREMSKINDEIIREFEVFPSEALSSLIDAISAPASGTKRTLQLKMSLTTDIEPLIEEINKVQDLMA